MSLLPRSASSLKQLGALVLPRQMWFGVLQATPFRLERVRPEWHPSQHSATISKWSDRPRQGLPQRTCHSVTCHSVSRASTLRLTDGSPCGPVGHQPTPSLGRRSAFLGRSPDVSFTTRVAAGVGMRHCSEFCSTPTVVREPTRHSSRSLRLPAPRSGHSGDQRQW
jgi:hypothetical protein